MQRIGPEVIGWSQGSSHKTGLKIARMGPGCLPGCFSFLGGFLHQGACLLASPAPARGPLKCVPLSFTKRKEFH